MPPASFPNHSNQGAENAGKEARRLFHSLLPGDRHKFPNLLQTPDETCPWGNNNETQFAVRPFGPEASFNPYFSFSEPLN